MSRDEGQTVSSDGPDTYEATVLSFLDKEIASVKPGQKKNDHSDDLDAIVSDLLKQVLIESDEAKPVHQDKSQEMQDLLSEFPPVEIASQSYVSDAPAFDSNPLESGSESFQSISEPEEPVKKAAAPSTKAEILPFERKQEESPRIEEAATEPGASPALAVPAFGVPAAPKSRMPMIALAAACILAILGGAAYHFLGSSKDAPADVAESQPAAATSDAVNIAPPLPPPEIPAAAAKQEPVAEKPAHQAAPSTVKSEPVKPATASSLALPAPPQEKPSLLQGGTQMAAASGSALDRLMPTAAPDKPKPPAAPRSTKAAGTPNSQPVVSGTLIPAVPVSQVSPKYPALAVKTRAFAAIVLDLVIDEKGNVLDATPVSGPSMFHKEAVDAAMKWRYRPASLGGVNVKSQTRITMNFKLK